MVFLKQVRGTRWGPPGPVTAQRAIHSHPAPPHRPSLPMDHHLPQVAGAVLRDPSPCDALADQVVTGAAARQVDTSAGGGGAGAGAGAGGWGAASGDSQDGGDLAFMSRLVNERLAAVGARAVLLPRG